MENSRNIPTRIFLIGPMGAGKSAVGKALAGLLEYPYADSDREIEQRCGVDIGFIFEIEGEDGFRRRERNIIDELTQREPIVLATGGGAVLDAENRRHLAGRGYVIYLETTVRQQLERTRRGKHRPLLETEDRAARLEALNEERAPLYADIADFVLHTDKRRVIAVARELSQHIRDLCQQEPGA